MASTSITCEHRDRSLLNPWESLRKYVCADCPAVMTCACDSDIATDVVPHQALRGRDQHTQDHVTVTHPLVPHLCHDCRDEAVPAYPKAAHRGAASLIHRYYWHEIGRETRLEFLAWCQSQELPLFDASGKPLFFELQREHHQQYDDIHGAVVERIRAAHAQKPKYDFTRPSDADVIRTYGVIVENIQACYPG